METRLTLRPGAKGTRKLAQRYGNRLVCVRYRYDPVAKVRYKTVELIVDQVPWTPPPLNKPVREDAVVPLVEVRVAYKDERLRQRLKAAGGYWSPARGLWLLPLHKAQDLDLAGRLVGLADQSI